MNISIKNLTIISVFSLFIITNLNAQEKLDEKLKAIQGSVDKIIITADGNEYVFEGVEAEIVI